MIDFERTKKRIKDIDETHKMKLENILKSAGKIVLIGIGTYFTYQFLMAYHQVLKEEGYFDRRKQEEKYPLFI